MTRQAGENMQQEVQIGPVFLGPGHPTRIIAPLTGSTWDALVDEIDNLHGEPIDLAEWRADMWPDPDELASVCSAVVQRCPVPVLATIRTIDEGGCSALDENAYAHNVRNLAVLAPCVDVEARWPSSAQIVNDAHNDGSTVIISAHNWELTPSPEEITRQLEQMAALDGDIVKVAYRAHSHADADAIMQAGRWAMSHLDVPTICIGMGEAGVATRLAGPEFGLAATFATVGASSAPGQLPAQQVAHTLRGHAHRAH